MSQTAHLLTPVPSHHEQLRKVLLRIETELQHIARAIDTSQGHVAAAAGALALNDAAFSRAMQEADLLSQMIAGIGEFMHAVAAGIPEEWEVDTHGATSLLKLAELERRIGANGHLRDVTGGMADTGDIDLF